MDRNPITLCINQLINVRQRFDFAQGEAEPLPPHPKTPDAITQEIALQLLLIGKLVINLLIGLHLADANKS
jgi:hypothetical protein